MWVISYACDVAGLLLADLLIHASCQRVYQLGLRHHPPAGDSDPNQATHANIASGVASGFWVCVDASPGRWQNGLLDSSTRLLRGGSPGLEWRFLHVVGLADTACLILICRDRMG
jgi:hypothetical protein